MDSGRLHLGIKQWVIKVSSKTETVRWKDKLIILIRRGWGWCTLTDHTERGGVF